MNQGNTARSAPTTASGRTAPCCCTSPPSSAGSASSWPSSPRPGTPTTPPATPSTPVPPRRARPPDPLRIVAALVNPIGPAPEAETVTLLNASPAPSTSRAGASPTGKTVPGSLPDRSPPAHAHRPGRQTSSSATRAAPSPCSTPVGLKSTASPTPATGRTRGLDHHLLSGRRACASQPVSFRGMAEGPSSQLVELRVSARGWHGIQLAAIGFVGFCGVMQDGRPDNPMWLQVCAGILVLVALALVCAGDHPRRPRGLAAGSEAVGPPAAEHGRGGTARRAPPQDGVAPDVRRARLAGARDGDRLVAPASGRRRTAPKVSSRSRRAAASTSADPSRPGEPGHSCACRCTGGRWSSRCESVVAVDPSTASANLVHEVHRQRASASCAPRVVRNVVQCVP